MPIRLYAVTPIAAIMLAACATGVETSATDMAAATTAVPREAAQAWARCYLAPNAGVLHETHDDVVCARGTAAEPELAEVVATIPETGATKTLGTEPDVFTTVAKSRPWRVKLSLRTAPSSAQRFGVSATFLGDLSLEGTSASSPAVATSPLSFWHVELTSEAPLLSFNVTPYAVDTGTFTTTAGALRAAPPPITRPSATAELDLVVPSSGSIEVGAQRFDGSWVSGTIDGPGAYVAGPTGIAHGSAADAGPTSPPSATTCGEPGQHCCASAAGCACNAFRVRDLFGTCYACGGSGEKACPGALCKPGLTADDAHVCR
jgi:hypothetical protein